MTYALLFSPPPAQEAQHISAPRTEGAFSENDNGNLSFPSSTKCTAGAGGVYMSNPKSHG